MTRARTIQALSAAIALLLVACGGGTASAPTPSTPPASAAPPQPSSAAPASASAKPAASVKPASAPSIAPAKPGQLIAAYSEVVTSNLPMWAAKEGGIFQKHGLDVDVRLIESSLSIGALLSSQVQLAGVGGSESLAAAVEGGDLKILATTTPVYPYVLEVAKDIQSAQDLKGKKLAISRIGSSSDIATRAGLKKLGLDPDKDVTIVQVGSLQARTAAMQSGAVQGSMANPPDNLTLESQGFHQLIDLASAGIPASNNGIVVQGAWVAAHKDDTQKYIDAYVESIARLKKDQAFAFDVMKKYLKLEDPKLLQATYDYWVGKSMPSLPYPKPEQFTDSVDVIAQKNPKAKTYDLSKLLDPSFVQSAADRGVDKS